VYEAIAAGRVPVIISDDWVPPEGPDWGAFSLRIHENESDSVIELLEEQNKNWRMMSEAAAAAHDTFFSEDVGFHWIAELLAGLREEGAVPPSSLVLRGAGAAAAAREKWSRLLPAAPDPTA
jgi:hypothetical protein